MLPNYQNLCPKGTQWLRRDAGVSFGGGGGRVHGDLQGFTILVFPCKSYLWNSVTAAKTIGLRYADLDPQGSLRP